MTLFRVRAPVSTPFTVELSSFGTFGGKRRGILWLDPDVRPKPTSSEDSPLLELQNKLSSVFPTSSSQQTKNAFRPHMTVGHFASIDNARQAQSHIASWWQPVSFLVDRVYLLHRNPDGPFLRVAEIGLGDTTTMVRHVSPQPFPQMPTVEDSWVREGRQQQRQHRRRRR